MQVILAEAGESVPASPSLPYKMVVVSEGAISVKRSDLDEEEIYKGGAFQRTGIVEIPAGVEHEIRALSTKARMTFICQESPVTHKEPRGMYLRGN